MKTISKIFIIGFIGALILAGGSWIKEKKFGSKLDTAQTDLLKQVAEVENNYFIIAKKYRQIFPQTIGDYTFWVDEWVMWDGKETPKATGYQIYFKKPDGSEMSTGIGLDAVNRNFSWTEPVPIVDNSATTTPL